jgi:hypothetical protein
MMQKSVAMLTGLILATGIAGCRIHVDKDSNGKEKNVQVDTPFGGVHVNTDQITAADLVKDKEHDKSADVNMGFGEWTLRVRAVNYSTPDPQDKVVAFYKKSLSRYGDVITCQGNSPVGTPTATSEGLTCADDGGHGHVQINDKDIGRHHGLQLKAGSKRHQHILGFEDPIEGRTRFALVALDLPAGVNGKSD